MATYPHPVSMWIENNPSRSLTDSRTAQVRQGLSTSYAMATSQQQIMLRQAELLTECTTDFLMVFPEAAGFVVFSQEPINSSVCHKQTRDQKAQHGP